MNRVGGCKGKDDASENTQHVDREWVGILLSVCRTGGLVKLSCASGKSEEQLFSNFRGFQVSG